MFSLMYSPGSLEAHHIMFINFKALMTKYHTVMPAMYYDYLPYYRWVVLSGVY